jgi:TorA maturation chaperone TorD
MQVKTRETGNIVDSLTPRQRSHIYGLLSLLYRREPNVELVDFLRKQGTFVSLSRTNVSLDEREQYRVSSKETAEKLAVDYTSLFVVPGTRIPLNESIQCNDDGLFLGKSAGKMKSFLKSLGIKVDSDWKGFSDHISVEFEVMRKTAADEGAAMEENDSRRAEKYRMLQVDFLNSHISRWVPQICDQIIARANTSFYRELATLTKAFIQHESTSLALGDFNE